MAKISPDLDIEVTARAAAGQSSAQIAEWLKASHGISISSRSLRSRLSATRKERVEAVKSAVQTRLSRSAVSDTDRLERIRRQVARKARSIADDPDYTRDWTILKRLEVDVIDRKLHYSGADAPDDSTSELSSAGERIRSRLARLAPEEGEGEPPPGARADPGG